MNISTLLTYDWTLQLTIIFSVLAIRAVILSGGTLALTRYIKKLRLRLIDKRELKTKPLIKGVLSGLMILFVDAVVAVILIKNDIWHFATEFNLLKAMGGFIVLFIWAEIYFYYSHWLLHKPALFFIHRHHHQSMTLNPWTSLSFSISERLILLFGISLLPALLSSWLALPKEVYISYFFMNYILNVYGHMNVEIIPSKFVKSFLGKVFLTPSYHALHHLRYNGHFGLFTSVLDRIHATYFTDYVDVHTKYYRGPI